jgi:hypothetical protein
MQLVYKHTEQSTRARGKTTHAETHILINVLLRAAACCLCDVVCDGDDGEDEPGGCAAAVSGLGDILFNTPPRNRYGPLIPNLTLRRPARLGMAPGGGARYHLPADPSHACLL